MANGKLYLIPCGLGGENEMEILAPQTISLAIQLKHFVVEKEKTARHFLKRIGITEIRPLQEVELFPLNKHTTPEEYSSYLNPCMEGHSMGIISEAGCPGVADPGAEVVKLAHEKGIEVIPLVGPSSILLALMASGMSGQSFVFHGYLPKNIGERNRFVKTMEHEALSKKRTQIFMETPFRNNQFLGDILQTCNPNTKLGIAVNITLPNGSVKTKAIKEWKKQVPDLHKKPTIFMLYGN